MHVSSEVTQAYVATAIAAALSNLPNRANVRAATTANVTIASAIVTGASLDGLTLAALDRVLVGSQSSPSENGLFLAGTKQVETATAAGSATASANATVTVTSVLVTGSPLAVTVALTNGDTAAQVAGKIRTALDATAAITDHFAVGGASTAITLTALLAAANDSTLNIAITPGTTGITAVPASANTTAGVAVARSSDADTYDKIAGAIVKANAGTANGDHLFQCISNPGGTLDVTALDWQDITLKLASATSSSVGVVELATDAEAVTGTDTARATTPANLTARLAAPGSIGSTTPATVVKTDRIRIGATGFEFTILECGIAQLSGGTASVGIENLGTGGAVCFVTPRTTGPGILSANQDFFGGQLDVTSTEPTDAREFSWLLIDVAT